jgi:alkylation response protein AidB-like acyl-CoA dehydrogenase
MTVDRNELVQRVRDMGPVLAERAVRYDREASFPFENFADFRDNGLLAVCVPVAYGGAGASYADYVRVSEEIGHYCGATALTFNMHNATMLWCGEVADMLTMSDADRAAHERIRTEMFRGVVEHAHIHSQPFSEGLAPGATSGIATRAVAVDGGWLVTGRKIFASLSGAADFYNVICQMPADDTVLFLGVPADADGVSIVDDWDPLGMRGTVSRTLLMNDVFVPAAHEWLPAGAYNQAAERYPWLFLSSCPSYLGLTGGVLDVTRPICAANCRGSRPAHDAIIR